MTKQDNSLSETEPSDLKWAKAHSVERALAKVTALVWRWSNDRQTVVAFVGRYSAHIAVLALILMLGTFGHITLTPVSSAQVSELPAQQAVAESVSTPTAVPTFENTQQWQAATQVKHAVFRQASPYTLLPERPRLGTITYTVQSGDNLTVIATRFKLEDPYSIIWSNMEQIQGTPWLIQPGLTLFIPPVDGVYYTVMPGDTIDSIAEQFEVPNAALFNVWNPIEAGDPLVEGMQLMIPAGVGELVDLEPPPPDPVVPGVASASASWGACGDVSVSGPGATGWFILPTGSTLVSGWYFHDVRNPGHIGLDYKCHLGDPIYAADSGVVIFSGWGGGYGNLVRVIHGNGYQTYYAHFDSILVGCGEPVVQGQLIGYCGTTGWSTGPHLHYEIRFNGVPQDPQLFE